MSEEKKVIELHPDVAKIASTFNLILTEEEKAVDPTSIPAPSISLGEAVVKAQDDRKEKKEEPQKTQAEIDAEKATADEQKRKDDEAAALKLKEEEAKRAATTTQPAQPQTVIKVVKQEPTPAKPTDEQVKAKKEEEDYIKGLTEDQREELEIAAFNDKKNGTDLRKQYLDYYKKVDAFDPNLSPDSDEFKKFTAENRPKWTPAQRRAAERQMLADEAEQRAIEAARRESEPIRIKQAEMEMQPELVKANEKLVTTLTTADAADADSVSIPKEIADKVLTMTPQQALAEYPIEAKVILGSRNAVNSYMRVVNGVERFDSTKNPVHAWIGEFLAYEGAQMKAKPDSETVVNGKRFLPIAEFIEVTSKDPAEASKYWTFSDQQVVDRIAKNGVTQYKNQVKALEKSGFVRPKVSTQAKTEAATTTTATTNASPKAGGKQLPGASAEESPVGKNAAFFSALNIPADMMPKD